MCGLILVLSWQTKYGQTRIKSYEAVKLSLDSLFQIPYEGADRLDMSAHCKLQDMRKGEKSDSLLSTCTHTHKHMCTHIAVEMNEAIHRKHKFCWFIRLGTNSHHLNLPELSCAYQKNVSPAVPVSLFHINVSLMISTLHEPNPEGLSQPWKWAGGDFLPHIAVTRTHHLLSRQAVFPAGMTASRRRDIPWGSPFRDFSESFSLGGLASPLPAGVNGLSPTGSLANQS